MYKGADISQHDGLIYFNTVADHLDFFILREGYGVHRDHQFSRYLKEIRSTRLKVPAIYHTIEDVSLVGIYEEATRCVSAAVNAELPDTTVIFGEIDCDLIKALSEMSGKLLPDAVIFVAEAWYRQIKLYGYFCGIMISSKDYTRIGKRARDFIRENGYVWLVDDQGDPDWICDVQTYSHVGRIEGMPTDVNLDFWYNDDLYLGKVEKEVPEEDTEEDSVVSTIHQIEYREDERE